jgi:hypothetical protein
MPCLAERPRKARTNLPSDPPCPRVNGLIGFCSAALQGGTLESGTCPPKSGFYKGQDEVLAQILKPRIFIIIIVCGATSIPYVIVTEADTSSRTGAFNRFRIKLLYDPTIQLPRNHILAKKRGGGGICVNKSPRSFIAPSWPAQPKLT